MRGVPHSIPTRARALVFGELLKNGRKLLHLLRLLLGARLQQRVRNKIRVEGMNDSILRVTEWYEQRVLLGHSGVAFSMILTKGLIFPSAYSSTSIDTFSSIPNKPIFNH